jgi:hypothetical protein
VVFPVKYEREINSYLQSKEHSPENMNMQQTSPEFNIAYLAYENVGHKKSNDRSKGKIVSGPTRPAVPKPKVDVCNKAL